jgi:hypothetical protein
MSKFVKTASTVNFGQTLVVLDEGAYMPRPAALRGGTWSRSGLTGECPFAEEGSFLILRRLEFLQAVGRGESPAPYYFVGHGAQGGYDIFQSPPVAEIQTALAAWKEFRTKGGVEPQADEEAGIMARAWTLHRFQEAMFLTQKEATEILPQRAEWAVWEEEETEEGKEPWVQIRTNLGYVTHSPSEEGWEGWFFTPQNHTCRFVMDEWDYRTWAETTPDEVVVRRERRKMDESQQHWVYQWEAEEDSCEWTESRPAWAD